MILTRPDAILKVAAKRALADCVQPLLMVEKTEILYDLDVPEIVPVTGVG